MLRARLSFIAALAAATLATPARADDAPSPDMIYTRDGSTVRGTLVDITPGVQARIQLRTGEITTVPWSEITRIDARSRPVAPPPSAPQATPTIPHRPPVTGATVVVHIESPRPVRLERLDASRPNWDEMCNAPCDAAVPLDGEYRIVGSGVVASNRFRFEASSGEHVVLEVGPSSKPWLYAGEGGFGAGLGIGLYGLFWYGFGASISSQPDRVSQEVSKTYTTLGIVMMVGGAALAAVGGLLMASNWSTSVTQVRASNVETSRAPAWRGDDVGSAMPKAMLAPVVTLSF